MRTLEDQMSFYAAYHQDGRNKATHFIGVPAIMLSLFIPLAWIRFEIGWAASRSPPRWCSPRSCWSTTSCSTCRSR